MSRPPLVPALDTLPDGVAHIELPTPFALGPVNCYVLLGDPVTVVDPGMLVEGSTDLLIAGLAGLGLAITDIAQVFVTHAHPDHFGAAAWVAERAGCEIVTSAVEAEKLQIGLDRPEFWALLRSLGAPNDVVDNFPKLLEAEREWMAPIDPGIVRTVADGDLFAAGDRQWRLIQTAGHAVGHLSLHDEASGALVAGDHLLPRITPNPIVQVDRDDPTGRRRSLIDYIESFERFDGLWADAVMPGHGPAFNDVPALLAFMRRHHVERAEKLLDLVKNRPAATPHDLSLELFPGLEGFGVLLGISEVVGHIDLLVADGRITEGRDDDLVRFDLS